MFCSKCGNENIKDANFCNTCGESLTVVNAFSTINGDGNLNFGQNNTIVSDNISVNYQKISDPIAYINRDKIIPIKLGAIPVTNKLTIFGNLISQYLMI
ncbi:hypothetical protein M947_10360 [Sulfurimonas hongkongensis]|uniref:Zinc-ribbon domain-containing protein n=1 Tax=Sulfurimonas hongkongensis TaxID=1172190 RepID=T0KDN0_9BACT|nr:zinc ribbon domain-containing protein [Sulfurimonas hongkongensis]EQB34864.1 hypothetical protein M947_10360 [Sulfurimonas hongkongensis]